MIKVAVNGYGTIGKRVADAVVAQSDMELVGVAKTRPNYEAQRAVANGYPLYAAIEDRVDQFSEAGIEIAGPVDDLIETADIVVDATPAGIGAANKPVYEDHETPAIFQGGEPDSLVDTSFNARSNFDHATDAMWVRVVSCNSTGISRLLAPLIDTYGIKKARVTLVRRGGDPSQSNRGPINDILPNPITLPSHHGPDVNTIFPDLDIDTMGLKVPSTLMHVHSVNVTLTDVPSVSSVRNRLSDESRLFLISEHARVAGTGDLKELALDLGRPRGDWWENCIWDESITIKDNDLYLFQAIHQESNVVPENIDAIRAVMGSVEGTESIAMTDNALGVGK